MESKKESYPFPYFSLLQRRPGNLRWYVNVIKAHLSRLLSYHSQSPTFSLKHFTQMGWVVRDTFLHVIPILRSCISSLLSCYVAVSWMIYWFTYLLTKVRKNLISGMTSSLLESVFIPGPKSDAKELYNITLVEKLLRILYASCQYGEDNMLLNDIDVRFPHS